LAAGANATIVLNNQSQFNGAATKLRMLKDRHPGEAHPLDVGTNAVARYFKIEDECAQAVRLKVLAASGGNSAAHFICGTNQSLPRQSGPPVGLMLVTRGGHDHLLFGNAATVERLFAA